MVSFFSIFAILFGIVIAVIVSSIILLISFIRNKKKDEKKNMGKLYKNILISVLSPSLVTGTVIALLWAAGTRYPGFPLELLISASIIITGLFLSITDKNAIAFFISLAVIMLFLMIRSSIFGIKHLVCKYKQVE